MGQDIQLIAGVYAHLNRRILNGTHGGVRGKLSMLTH